MSVRLLIAAGLAVGLQACASSGGDEASKEVKAVVVDENARQAAQAEVVREADSREALDAAGDAASEESPR